MDQLAVRFAGSDLLTLSKLVTATVDLTLLVAVPGPGKLMRAYNSRDTNHQQTRIRTPRRIRAIPSRLKTNLTFDRDIENG